MKNILIVCAVVLFASGFSAPQGDNVEFSCMKKHKASNTCYFNFKVDGAPYQYIDMGCRYESRKDEIIQKAKEGGLALGKDWKIACPEAKPKSEKDNGSTGF